MLDKIPAEFWKKPQRVFEPCCGKGNFVLGIFDKKPKRPVLIPRIGIPELRTNETAFRNVPSPPKLIMRSKPFCRSWYELKVWCVVFHWNLVWSCWAKSCSNIGSHPSSIIPLSRFSKTLRSCLNTFFANMAIRFITCLNNAWVLDSGLGVRRFVDYFDNWQELGSHSAQRYV